MSDDIESFLAAVAEAFTEDLREDVAESGHLLDDLFVEAAPVRSGRFRGSLECAVGDVPEGEGLPAKLPFYPTPGHDLIDAALEEWKLGQDVVFADQVPYAERLAHGYSPQAADGWVDVITQEVAEAKHGS